MRPISSVHLIIIQTIKRRRIVLYTLLVQRRKSAMFDQHIETESRQPQMYFVFIVAQK